MEILAIICYISKDNKLGVTSLSFVKNEIAGGVELISVPTDQFKTNELAISFAVKLDKNTVSANAVLINLLSRKCAKYPTMLALNKKLASLYGATVYPVIQKNGDHQVLTLGMTCLNDRFAIGNESISYECVKLLTSLVFEPNENGFLQEDVDTEKRIIIEKIKAEENEKREYAANKAIELMFEGDPFSLNKFGSVEFVEAVTVDDVQKAWENILSTAKVLVTAVGNTDTDKILAHLTERFSKLDRKYIPLENKKTPLSSSDIKERVERIDVKQGKLVLCYDVDTEPYSPINPAMRSFCDIFGGGPYSKLFANVREKLSLCYYCSASFIRAKSYIIIQSGCLEENMDKAIAEIDNQLNEIISGNFDDEFNSSKIALKDMLLSVEDSPVTIQAWYSSQILDKEYKTPEMSAMENDAVTKEQIIECANLIKLNTIYKLTSLEEAE